MTNDNIKLAHKIFRVIQTRYGSMIKPVDSIRIGQEFEDAIKKDPTGQQAVRYAEDLLERLTPMKQ